MHQEQAREAHKVTLIGSLLDTLLGVLKIVIGWASNSHALIADGIHSLSDLLTDVLVIGVTHYGRQAPDQDHPYGHARYETIGTLVLGSLLMAVAGAIAYDSAVRLFKQNELATPGVWAIAITLLSIAGKEWIFHYTMRVAKKIKSDLLVANAWHSRSDALSSIVVLVGIVGTMMGVHWLDQVAALIVGLMVAHIGWGLVANSMKELVDTALPTEETEAIRAQALSVEGVRDVHSLRTRKMGSQIFLDIHLQVNPKISVSEGHQIGVKVARLLREQHEDVQDITFHIDAEDDSEQPPAPIEGLLPLRKEVIQQLRECWQDQAFQWSSQQLTLHYLNNRIDIDLLLTEPAASEISEAKLKACLAHQAWLGQFRLWQRKSELSMKTTT